MPKSLGFDEHKYGQFDFDAIRPPHVQINDKLNGTAIVHRKEVLPSSLPESETFHRAKLHSDESLPLFEKQIKSSAAAD